MEIPESPDAAEILEAMPAAVFVKDGRRRIQRMNGAGSEAEYRAILRTTLDAFWVNDLAGRFLDVNDAYCRMLGYAREELLSMCLSHVEAVETPDDTRARIAKVIETGFDRFESKHRRKDGVVIDVEVTVTYLPVGEGRLIVFARDITERIRAENAARQATQRFETLAAASFEGIAITVEGRLTDANDRLLQMFGYERNEAIGRHVTEFMTPSDAVAALAAIASGRDNHAEYEVLCKDGSRRLAEVRSRIVEQDGRSVRLTAVRDITEHRRAEQTIRQSEARLRAHIENSPMAVVAWGGDFKVTQWSEEAERMFGWTAAETIGTYIADLNMVYPPDIPIVEQTMAKLSDGVSRYVVTENRNVTKDGRVIHCVWYNSNLLGDDGTMQSILSQVLDVTERKRAEDALKSAKLEAERAGDAKSRFLAAVSHDLRQPLSALSLYVGALEHRLGPSDGQLLSNMKNCVVGLNEMLSNLLNLSRLEAGAVVPKVSDFSLAAALAKVVSAHEPEARSKRLQLRWRHPDVIGRTDPVLFQRIVGNLIANAIRYTERGGVLIGCRRRNGKTWLKVWDTGIGIPEDKTTEIFGEFKQLGNSARNRVKGTGLGLAIVAKTAALLGLEVRVRSRLGRGSMFAVELPLGTQVAPTISRRYPRGSLRIALVEDDSHVADALAYALGQLGHQLVAAESAEQLMPLLGGEAPHIVISDYRLAGSETGLGVVTAVRRKFNRNVPAIIITGDTEPSLIRLIEENAIRLLHKPLDIDVLQSAIAEAVQ